jgi:UrcA family protein
MTKITSRSFVLGGAAVFMLSMSLPALAENGDTVTRINVATHDIDLSSSAGIQKLHSRVNFAIRSACAPVEFGGATEYGTREAAKAQDACLAEAHAAAAPQVEKLVAYGNPKVASN